MTTFQDPFGILKLIAQPECLSLDEEELQSLLVNEKFHPQLRLLGDEKFSDLGNLHL